MPEHQDKPDRVTSENVIDMLAALYGVYGVPQRIRSDNGPELISSAIKRWLALLSIHVLYIEPSSP